MVSPASVQEIERALNAEFARKGWGGSIVLRGESAELHGQGTVLAIELGDWLEQWELLPPDMRNQHVQHAAQRLRNCLPMDQRQLAPASATADRIKRFVYVSAIPLTVVALLYVVWNRDDEPVDPPQDGAHASPSATAAPVLDPATRSKEVCAAARKRLYAGANMGMDSAGWVVELWLAKKGASVAKHPKLAEFKDPARVAGQLGTVVPGKVRVVVAAGKGAQTSQVTLRLEEGFVAPFMERLSRPRYVQMMHRAADAVGAEYAALYARCAHLRYRDIGAAFRGSNPQGVVASLLFVQGLSIDPPAFAPSAVKGRSDPLGFLSTAQGSLSQEQLRQQALRSGGRLSQSSEDAAGGAWTTITFGLGAPMRSQKLARVLAERAKLPGHR